MPEDLPIYSQSMLRTRLQFADLERLKGMDLIVAWEKSDKHIENWKAQQMFDKPARRFRN